MTFTKHRTIVLNKVDEDLQQSLLEFMDENNTDYLFVDGRYFQQGDTGVVLVLRGEYNV